MGVVDYTDVDQVTSKWDGLMKDFKKVKEYLEGTGVGNWWGMSKVKEKNALKV